MSRSPQGRLRRSWTRALIACALILTGAVAATRVSKQVTPRMARPQLWIEVQASAPIGIESFSQRIVEPIERGLSRLPEIRDWRARLTDSTAFVEVELAPGTHPERFAGLLEEDLRGLRSLEGDDLELNVLTTSQRSDEPALVVWSRRAPPAGAKVGRKASASTLADQLERLPAVRWVELAAPTGTVTSVSLPDSAKVDDAGQFLRQRLESAPIAELLVHEDTVGLEGAWQLRRQEARLTALESLLAQSAEEAFENARIELDGAEPELEVRVNGEAGDAWLLWAADDRDVLAVGREVDALLETIPADQQPLVLFDAAEPLRSLVGRIFLTTLLLSVAATVCGALVGGLQGLLLGIGPLASLGFALNLAWLADAELDLLTVPFGWIGLLTFWPTAWLAGTLRHARLDFAVLLGLGLGCLVIATRLVAPELVSGLRSPTTALALGAFSGLTVGVLLPVPLRRHRPAWSRALARLTLRGAAATSLTMALVVWATWSWFAPALEPRGRALEAPTADLQIDVTLTAEATLTETREMTELLEDLFASQPGVAQGWTLHGRGWIRAFLQLGSDTSTIERLRIEEQLQSRLQRLDASVRWSRSERALRREAFSASILDESKTDDLATTYEFLVLGTDFEAVRTTEARILEELPLLRIPRRNAISGWGEPTRQLVADGVELTTDPVGNPWIEAAAEYLRQPLRMRWPGSEADWIEIRRSSGRARFEPPRQREDLERVLRSTSTELVTRPASLELRQEPRIPVAFRQNGQFVLPIRVALPGSALGRRIELRDLLHFHLTQFSSPAGSALDLPLVRRGGWHPDELKLVGLALLTPLLMLFVGAVRTSSLSAPLVLAPVLTVAVGAAAIVTAASLGHADDVSWLALIAGLCVSMAVGIWWSARTVTWSAGEGHAVYSHQTSTLLPALLTAAFVLASGWIPTFGLAGLRVGWVAPLRIGAVVCAVSVALFAVWLLPASRALTTFVRDRRRTRDERIRLEEVGDRGEISLHVSNLTKEYATSQGVVRALHALDLELGAGITGVLGPNGAGKTTLLRLVSGLLEPSRGQLRLRDVRLLPENRAEWRRRVGFLPQEFRVYPGLQVREVLDYWALQLDLGSRTERDREIQRVLAAVDLSEAAGRIAASLSGGMQRRVGIARALLGDPEVVIVDEPTTGLDVASRNRLRQSLLEVSGDRVVLFSTHIASDVAAAASRVVLLAEGRLLFSGSSRALVDRARGSCFEVLVDEEQLREATRRVRVTTRVRTPQGARIRYVTLADPLGGTAVDPSLEEAYLLEMLRAGDRLATVGEEVDSILDLAVDRRAAARR